MNQYNINWLTERYENGDKLQFLFFWGHTSKHNNEIGKYCLSQWAETPFSVNNIIYSTAEHWMMAQKAMLFGDKAIFDKVIQCTKPGEAKALGQQILRFDEQVWYKAKFDIVKTGNIHKFNQHPLLAEYLLKTKNSILVEASPTDNIWGIGLSQDSNDIENIYAWKGQNLLGFALMTVRDFLKEFGHFQPLDNTLEPPWIKFPDLDCHDMFWKMGSGEDYLVQFCHYYLGLSKREKIIYQYTNPQPINWSDFYDFP